MKIKILFIIVLLVIPFVFSGDIIKDLQQSQIVDASRSITLDRVIEQDKSIKSQLCEYQEVEKEKIYEIVTVIYQEIQCDTSCSHNQLENLSIITKCEQVNCKNIEKQREEQKLVEEKSLYACKIVNYETINNKILPKYKEKEGCYICATNPHKYICYNYVDGFAENIDEEWKCNCKSGTSCIEELI